MNYRITSFLDMHVVLFNHLKHGELTIGARNTIEDANKLIERDKETRIIKE